jgi:hypothetical protein
MTDSMLASTTNYRADIPYILHVFSNIPAKMNMSEYKPVN